MPQSIGRAFCFRVNNRDFVRESADQSDYTWWEGKKNTCLKNMPLEIKIWIHLNWGWLTKINKGNVTCVQAKPVAPPKKIVSSAWIRSCRKCVPLTRTLESGAHASTAGYWNNNEEETLSVNFIEKTVSLWWLNLLYESDFLVPETSAKHTQSFTII